MKANEFINETPRGVFHYTPNVKVVSAERLHQLDEDQQVNELFDPKTALPLEWTTTTRPMPDGFIPKKVTYAQHIDNNGRVLNILFAPYANDNIVDISFDYEGLHKITGSGQATQILATVVSAINKYISVKHPYMISFSAKEPSRVKLYKHMIQRLLGGYELLSPEQYPSDGDLKTAQAGVGTFFLLRQKA